MFPSYVRPELEDVGDQVRGYGFAHDGHLGVFLDFAIDFVMSMDTGLAPGIPVFYMSDVEVTSPAGDTLAYIEMFEPVSENPTLTLKPLVGDDVDELLVYARDTEANEFRFSSLIDAIVTSDPFLKRQLPNSSS